MAQQTEDPPGVITLPFPALSPPEGLIQGYVYHGTSAAFLKAILDQGIEPPSISGRSNYDDALAGTLKSHPDFVYLTRRNYLSHALKTTLDQNYASQVYQPALILRVSLERLDVERLHPDEDFLGLQARELALLPNTLSEREHQIKLASIRPNRAYWVNSLLHEHENIAHEGIVPLAAVSAISVVHTDPLLADCFNGKFNPDDQSGGLKFRTFAHVPTELSERVESALMRYVWGQAVSEQDASEIREFLRLTSTGQPNKDSWEENIEQMMQEGACVFDPHDPDPVQRAKCLEMVGL